MAGRAKPGAAPAAKTGGKPGKANWQDVFKKKDVGVDDMTLLSKVRNEDISDNLQKRFTAGFIYTYIGHVLIAVNPYRDLGLYTQEILHSYTGKNRIEMPPHVYATAEAAYRQLVGYAENQCVIISGESGAGKTESAKKIMEYIAEVSTSQAQGSSSAGVNHVREIVLATNPLLESFGNAKTLRNNNSSRFGKYFEIEFSRAGEPLGGVITNYLLEKGRVVSQIKGERNFHIFYNFCRGATNKHRQDFQLQGPEAYVYTSASGCLVVDGMNDAQDFNDVLNAMNVIGISANEQQNIFQLLAAILWTGNITFQDAGSNSSRVRDETVMQMVGYLLEIDPIVLTKVMGTRVMETSRGGQRGTTYNVPLNAAQACSVRDAMAKAIYTRLFDWIVQRINKAMVQNKADKLVIGVLDIYGFEIFEHNSFEQLCINYVNEKLQQIFIELTLKQEQEEYVREKIKWTPIEFFNNKVVCDLIEEKKPSPGIFSVMDDACATAHADPTEADRALMQRLGGACSSHPHYKDLGQAGFMIRHYAGDVTYEAAGMTDKNKDQLVFDLLEALQLTSNQFLLSLFPDQIDRDSKKRPTTASTKIKTSCNDLVAALSRCTPHYIRCIKPNDNKSHSEYDQRRCMHQVKYLGLLENIRVRRAGFAYRQNFEKFLEHFFLLSRRTSYAGEFIWQGDVLSGCRSICEDCGIARDEWQIGTTKVFIRSPETLWALEHLRERYWHNMAMKIQRAYRNYVRYKHECATRIQRQFRSWNQTKVFMQIRDYGHQVLGGQKERRRFSLLSMRRFLGDYLDIRTNQVLLNACGGSVLHEGVVFSSKGSIWVQRLLKGPKMSPRFIIMTRAAIYIIQTKVEKNMAVTTLERRIPVPSIQGVVMSPYMDDCIVLQVPSDADAVLFTIFKTEFATHLAWQKGGQLTVRTSPTIDFQKKPGKLSKIQFGKDETVPNQEIIKKNVVVIASGMPANSVSFPPCRRNERAARPITKGKLLRKGGPAQSSAGAGARQAPTSATTQRAAPAGSAAGRADVAPPKPAPPPAAKAVPTFKALYAYQQQDEGEISFPAGAILEVVQKDDNGWWSARYNGQQGWVPSNYLEEIKVEQPKPTPRPPQAAAVSKPQPSAAVSAVPAAAPVAAAAAARPPMGLGGGGGGGGGPGAAMMAARSNGSSNASANASAGGGGSGGPPQIQLKPTARPPPSASSTPATSAAPGPSPSAPKITPGPPAQKPSIAPPPSAGAPAMAPKPAIPGARPTIPSKPAMPPKPAADGVASQNNGAGSQSAAPKPMMLPKPAVARPPGSNPPAAAVAGSSGPRPAPPKPTPMATKPAVGPPPAKPAVSVKPPAPAPGGVPPIFKQRPPSDDEDNGGWD